MIVNLIEQVYSFLWGDLIHIPLPGGGSVGISLLIILLIPAGIYFTIRTKVLPIRLFPDMVAALTGKKEDKNSLSTFQTLIVFDLPPVLAGKSGWCGCSCIGRRRRSRILDVGDGADWFINCIC